MAANSEGKAEMFEISIATYNIHKGYSALNRRFVLHELRENLRKLNADIVFLQEVRGEHEQALSPRPQHEFIAQDIWPHHAYGKNAVYDAGHHGNAILSRLPILNIINTDVSAHRFEQRGVLHCEIELPNGLPSLHCLCVHLGLFAKGRGVQFDALAGYIRQVVPASAPLIIAGDFNDWRNHAQHLFAQQLNLHEAFEMHAGQVARSFPVRFPMFKLDRIYVRGLTVTHSAVHAHAPWNRISDHAALTATVCLP